LSDGVYILVSIGALLTGLVVGTWRLALAALALWAVGLAIAAVGGAFRATSEDTGLGLFLFAAIPTVFWVLLATLGVGIRRMVEMLRAREPPGNW
jgi:TRAP-type uncharacterized transport system fused permease subunit